MVLLALGGCVVRFVNADRRVDSSFRKIFVPAATDTSTRGGQAARLSAAIRRAIALDTRFALVSMEEARWALDVQVRNSQRQTAQTSDCERDADKNSVASGAYSCDSVKLSFSQPSVSSETEVVSLSVNARAIDLQTGRALVSTSFDTITSGELPVVGTEAVQRNLARTPELHALRYVENIDRGVENIADKIAASLLNTLLSLDPKALEVPTPTPSPTPSALPLPVPLASPNPHIETTPESALETTPEAR